jgi:Ku70/Ku80 N-terminal alpha/beta domain
MDFEDLIEDGGEIGEDGAQGHGISQDMFMFGMDEKEIQEMK